MTLGTNPFSFSLPLRTRGCNRRWNEKTKKRYDSCMCEDAKHLHLECLSQYVTIIRSGFFELPDTYIWLENTFFPFFFSFLIILF